MTWVNAALILASVTLCLLLQPAFAPLAAAQPAKHNISAKDELAAGRLYYSTDDFPQAIEQFSKAIKSDPDSGLLYYERGHAYYKLDRYIQAIPDYTRSLHLKYQPSLNYERRAFCYLNAKQYKQGIADCTDAIKNDPFSRIAYFNRSKAYALTGDVEKSKADRAKIKELDKHPRAKDLCDRCRISHNQYERLQLSSEALKLDPKYAPAVLLLGSAYLTLEKKKEALDCFNKLATLEPDNLTAYLDRGLCRLQFGAFGEGIKDLSFVLERAPECYEAYYWRGECHTGLNETKAALQDYQKAIAIMQSKMASDYARTNNHYHKTIGRALIETLRGAAHAYEKEGNLPKAIEEITSAIKESRVTLTSLAELLPERAEMYKKAGRIDEMHADLLAAKSVADKLEEIKRGPYIPPPPMRSGKDSKDAKAPDNTSRDQLPD